MQDHSFVLPPTQPAAAFVAADLIGNCVCMSLMLLPALTHLYRLFVHQVVQECLHPVNQVCQYLVLLCSCLALSRSAACCACKKFCAWAKACALFLPISVCWMPARLPQKRLLVLLATRLRLVCRKIY